MAKHDSKRKKMSKQASYDKENDVLFMHQGFASDEKFKGNIDVGNLVLDVSTKGRIRGVEIMNASAFLEELRIGKKALEDMESADFTAQISHNSITITLFLKSGAQEIPARIAVPLATARI